MTEQFGPGQLVFAQGDQSDFVYVVESGEVEVFRPDVGGIERTLTTLKAGDYFGELGPALGLPRNSSSRARTPATLIAYDVGTFRRKYASRPNRRSREGTTPSTGNGL